jgi:exodeoxyribonuclease VII small subunit
MSPEKKPTFEERMASLEEAVRRLESGEEPLERSLEIYEEVVGHLKACHGILKGAEKRVKVLTETADGELVEEDFDPGE